MVKRPIFSPSTPLIVADDVLLEAILLVVVEVELAPLLAEDVALRECFKNTFSDSYGRNLYDKSTPLESKRS